MNKSSSLEGVLRAVLFDTIAILSKQCSLPEKAQLVNLVRENLR